jgi:hypothetical protein
MLSVTQLAGLGGARDTHFLYDIITRQGLLSSALSCLDAADPLSYTSGQTIVDRVGGNNHFLGSTSGADATDPALVGPAGDAGAYFSTDGTDFFIRTAAQTFDANWHKDNGAFTLVVLYYPLVTKSSFTELWANRIPGASNAGVLLRVNVTTGLLSLRRSVTTTTTATDNSSAAPVGGAWNFLAAGWDDASSLVRMQINATHESQAGTPSTDTDPVSGVQYQMADGAGVTSWESGERWAGMMAFNRLLTESEMLNLRNAVASTRPGYA